MEGAGDAIAKCVKAAQEAGAPRRGVLCQLLKLVEAASPALASAGKETRKAIVAALCGQCCAKDAGVGKLAAQCLSTSVLADATRARTFATLVSKLRPALDMKAGAQQHAALAVLAALAKRAPEALGEKAERSALLAHLRDEVTRKPAAADADAAKGGKKKAAAAAAAGGDALSPRSSAALGARCESQRLTLLLLANEALGAAGKAASDLKVAAAAGADLLSGGDDDDGDEGESVGVRTKLLVALLHRVLQKEGAIGAAAAGGDYEQAQLRLAAGKALLKSSRISDVKIKPAPAEAWRAIALTMQDEDASVREGLLHKLHRDMMRPWSMERKIARPGAPAHYNATRKAAPPMYNMAAYALAATDPKKEVRLQALANLTAIADNTRKIATQHSRLVMMPEMQLPWLLSALAHSPDYEDDLARSFADAQRCVDLYVSAMIGKGATEFDLLGQIVGKVKRARPRPVAGVSGGVELQVIADVASQVVLARGRAFKWSEAFSVHEQITLPPALFDPHAAPAVDKDYLPRGFALSDAVGKGGAEKRRASGSAAGGGGRAGEGGGGVSAEKKPRPSSAGKGEAKGEAKGRSSTGSDPSPKARRSMGLPSPLPTPGSSAKKPAGKKRGKKKKEWEEEDEEEEEEESEEEGEEEEDEEEESEEQEEEKGGRRGKNRNKRGGRGGKEEKCVGGGGGKEVHVHVHVD